MCRDGREAALVFESQQINWGRCTAIVAHGRSYKKWWLAKVFECSHTLIKETDLWGVE